MRYFSPLRFAATAISVLTSVALSGAVQAQINGDFVFVRPIQTYFILGDTTIDGDITPSIPGGPASDSSGNNVFVGKDIGLNTFTPKPSINLSVTAGANIKGVDETLGAGVTYNGLYVFGGNIIAVTGGNVDRIQAFDQSLLTVTGGRIGSITNFGFSTMVISGTGQVIGLVGHDHGLLNITGSCIVAGVATYDKSQAMVSDGAVNMLESHDKSNVSIVAGKVVQTEAADSSTLQISGSALVNAITSHDKSSVTITGGVIGNATALDSSVLSIKGGMIGSVQGGDTSSLALAGGSDIAVVDISDGTVNLATAGFGSVFNITGGYVGGIINLGGAKVNIGGSAIIGSDTIYQYSDDATVDFFGRSLLFSDPTAVSLPNGLSGVFYDVVWTRPDGQAVDTHYFDVNGSLSDAAPQGIVFTYQASVVPEPGVAGLSLCLLLFGASMLRRRRHRIGSACHAFSGCDTRPIRSADRRQGPLAS
jgi:hypothetical protein